VPRCGCPVVVGGGGGAVEPAWCETDRATEPAPRATAAVTAAIRRAGRWTNDDAVMVTSVDSLGSLDSGLGEGHAEYDVRRWRLGVRVKAYVSGVPVAVALWP
jgi:hypothetical protein